MVSGPAPPFVLVADDDPDDRVLTSDAFTAAGSATEIDFVRDGVELIEYLRQHRGKEAPDLVLLDLNMPRLDGRQALRRIKSDPALRRIPIVVFTTSSAPEDVGSSYDAGANSVVTKPASFADLVGIVRSLDDWWFTAAQLPGADGGVDGSAGGNG